jgi:HEPN domain-containing protein
MSNKDQEFSLEWLEKARHDLYAANKLAEDKDGPGDIIAFHCQQSIEKAIKGLLTAYGITFPRTHELTELLDLSLPYLSALDTYRDDFSRISRYAVEIRYPDSGWELNPENLARAIKISFEVFKTVESHLGSLQ